MSKIALSPNASGTGTFSIASPGTNTDRTLTLPDAAGTLSLGITLGTAVASTSGTAIDFTGIPSWAKRVTVMLDGVSTSGTSLVIIQLGDSGGVETSGYSGGVSELSSLAFTANSTSFAIDRSGSATTIRNLTASIIKTTGNSWLFSSAGTNANQVFAASSGSKTLSDSLTQVRITTVNGTDTFDAGTINISYEG
jgi:hypothetical protein